jgi:hexosaminidase
MLPAMRRQLLSPPALALLSSLCAATAAAPQPPALPSSATHTVIPAPASVELSEGTFTITPDTVVIVPAGNDRVRPIGRFIADLIGTAVGPAPPRVEDAGSATPAGSIHLTLRATPGAGDESYELTITPERVTIAAANPAGLFYGAQTLRQFLPPYLEHSALLPDATRPVSAPAGRITDAPRFAWRGAMLDVSRHFVRVEDVKRYIDLLALHKMNRLHLHLSDDQGWRIEIKSWPNLTRHGGSTQVGGGPGGFYTQDQYADLVEYAQERFVTIVPEIDMPGHTNAALSSYPELNCDGVAPALYTGIEVGFSALCTQKDITYKFIDDVVREIAALTPGLYFHIGGDEVKTLSDEDYVRFIDRVQAIVESHGKRVIGWDEVSAANLRPASLVQHWRPDNVPAAAVAKGVRVVLSPANRIYLDMKYDTGTALGLNWAGYVDVPDAYSWDPVTMFEGLEEWAIAGVEAPIWSETLVHLHEFEYMAFPRLAGVAEIGWSRADRRSWDEFKVRLGAQAARWAALGINFYRSPSVPWQH